VRINVQRRPYDQTFGLENLCLILVGYQNEILFLCVVVGVRKANIEKITFYNIISKCVWRWERNDMFSHIELFLLKGETYLSQVLSVWLWVYFETM
jgi:hypothetical protein